MRSRTRQFALWILLAIAACGPEGSGQISDSPDGLFMVNGKALALHCSSGPTPTVIIDAGLGDWSEDWQSIAEDLGSQTSICIFDRAGYGDSDPGLLPRSPLVNAQELRALLNVAEIQPPFVLVGHSLGGLNAQAFWTQYPGDVAGMILLDPPPRAFLERGRFPGLWDLVVAEGEDLQARAAQARRDSASDAGLMEAMASEHQEMLRLGAIVAGIDSFGDLPLLVVAAGRPNLDYFGDSAMVFQQFWIDENRALAGRSTVGRVEVLDSIGHAMSSEAPSVILDLIRGFLVGI
jgi:pimeloyl-ACP methyl ester carboxylesterase